MPQCSETREFPSGDCRHVNVLITGVAGFIGAALAQRLLERGDGVFGIDNLNAYYDVSLKEARLSQLRARPGFSFQKLDIVDRDGVARLFRSQRFDAVMHLAAQAGVRYSIENPGAYIDSNLVGFGNILEGCRHGGVAHLVFASLKLGVWREYDAAVLRAR